MGGNHVRCPVKAEDRLRKQLSIFAYGLFFQNFQLIALQHTFIPDEKEVVSVVLVSSRGSIRGGVGVGNSSSSCIAGSRQM